MGAVLQRREIVRTVRGAIQHRFFLRLRHPERKQHRTDHRYCVESHFFIIIISGLELSEV